MKSHEPGRNAAVPRWAVGLALLAWLGFLAVWMSRANENALELSAETLHNWVALSAWIRAVLWHTGKLLVFFVPVGFLSVFCLPARASWLDRALRRWLPALVISIVLAAVVRSCTPGRPRSGCWAWGCLGQGACWAAC